MIKKILILIILGIVLVNGCATEMKEPQKERTIEPLRTRVGIRTSADPSDFKESIYSIIPKEHRANFREYGGWFSVDLTEKGHELFNENEEKFDLGTVYFYSILDPSEVPKEPKIPYVDKDIYKKLKEENKTLVLIDGKGAIDYDKFFDLTLEEKKKLVEQNDRLRKYTEFEVYFYFTPRGGHPDEGDGVITEITEDELNDIIKLGYAKSIYLPLSDKNRYKIEGYDREIIIITNSREFYYIEPNNISGTLFVDWRIINELETGANTSYIGMRFHPDVKIRDVLNEYSEDEIIERRIYEKYGNAYLDITKKGLEKIKRDKRINLIRKPVIGRVA